MPKQDFHKTAYPGVSFIWGKDPEGKKEKHFYITFRKDGRLIVEKAGTAGGDMTPARANHLRTLKIKGKEPTNKEKRETEAAKKQAVVTLAEAWPVYLKDRQKKWSARYLLDHQRMIDPGGRLAKVASKGEYTKPGALAALRDKQLTEITPEAVKKWLEAENATRPTQAGYAFGILRSFMNWASEHDDYKALIDLEAVGRRIKKKLVAPKKAKDDCLQKEQLRAWFGAVSKIPNRTISVYLQGLLLTGARRNEIATLLWEDVDFQWRSMTIHDKAEGERTIPLPPFLAAGLYTLPRINKYVFASKSAKSGFIQEPRKAHNRACETAGIDGMTLHGLRRSFGTLSEWIEAPTGVVAQIMGHKPSAIAEKHYRKRPLDLLRLWHVKIEGWILEQAGIPQPAEDAEIGKLRAVK